ncbi:hypothetical protein RF11_00460 [Thelohanellus kitauei]|uniref:Uncharacterized protein n=1 Tax=Thelohanellus kitauei TaxID=669202 RepID=A0A0C2MSC0_THEKT|nr:hypothetical protein RF11_00460 [Thelohanellus kitauei]
MLKDLLSGKKLYLAMEVSFIVFPLIMSVSLYKSPYLIELSPFGTNCTNENTLWVGIYVAESTNGTHFSMRDGILYEEIHQLTVLVCIYASIKLVLANVFRFRPLYPIFLLRLVLNVIYDFIVFKHILNCHSQVNYLESNVQKVVPLEYDYECYDFSTTFIWYFIYCIFFIAQTEVALLLFFHKKIKMMILKTNDEICEKNQLEENRV